jgi:uncharacterized delta-60 repeat protein
MKAILLTAFFTISCFAQVKQQWVQRYNGPENLEDEARAVAIDKEGNIYVTGYSDGGAATSLDYATVKYNSDGVQQWIQKYNGPGNFWDIARAIVLDNEGNVYVTGYSMGGDTEYDFATIKYNSDGMQQWVRRYNGPGNGSDGATAIALDSEGNIYVTGGSTGNETHSDYTTIKYNSDGTELWVQRYNGTDNYYDAVFSMAVDSNNNIYVTGVSSGSGKYSDYLTIKYNSSGAQLWVRSYNGPSNYVDEAHAVAVDIEGNVYVTGYSWGNATDYDYATIKYNSDGAHQWVKRYNGTGNSGDVATAIAVDNESNIYVTGRSSGNGTGMDYTTIKYNSDGFQQWIQRYNSAGNSHDDPTDITIDNEGNIYVTGGSDGDGTNFDYTTIKYNSSGAQQWVQRYNGPGSKYDYSRDIVVDNEGNVYITGDSWGNGTNYDYATIKYSQARYPVLIVPGVAGTYAADVDNDLLWLLNRGTPPENIQEDPLANVYTDLIHTLENVGYQRGKDLFVVNYDWRLLPGPIDGDIDGYIEGLTGQSISDSEFDYGVDYLGYYLREAANRWRVDYDEELEYVDVIVHSTGGLVTRSYIQSGAYGDVYDAVNNYKLPRIRNFMMIGVPNRGASKAWNPLHDNWIADPAYRFVLSKIVNRAFQKIKKGYDISGPDYYITWGSILDSLGNPDKIKFISKYVPTIRGLLATYDFIDFGGGLTNVNNDPVQRNNLILDLNDGYDLYSNADPNKFLDSAIVYVLFGTGQNTFDYVQQRDDGEINAIHSFTDWTRSSVLPGTIWFKDMASGNYNGDGTVPLQSSVGQFLADNRATKLPFNISDHTGMVQTIPVQSSILDILNINYDQNSISTGSGAELGNVLSIVSDPVESIITDGLGRRLGYTNSAGKITEIPNSSWIGNTEGVGYVFGAVPEPITLQLTGLGEDYYVMVSVEDSLQGGGVVLEGFLANGEQITYQIELNPLSVEKIEALNPNGFTLAQNYPNPFNPVTTIQFSIPQRSNVTLKVYDILGNEVATLVNEEKDRGVYSVNFSASGLASGMYLYRLQAGSFIETKKMILIK